MEQEHAQAAFDAYQKFQQFYEDDKIFFNDETCENIDKLREKYWAGFFGWNSKAMTQYKRC